MAKRLTYHVSDRAQHGWNHWSLDVLLTTDEVLLRRSQQQPSIVGRRPLISGQMAGQRRQGDRNCFALTSGVHQGEREEDADRVVQVVRTGVPFGRQQRYALRRAAEVVASWPSGSRLYVDAHRAGRARALAGTTAPLGRNGRSNPTRRRVRTPSQGCPQAARRRVSPSATGTPPH